MANSEDHQNFAYGVGFTFIEERMIIYLLSKVGKLVVFSISSSSSNFNKIKDLCEDSLIKFMSYWGT